MLRSQQMRSLIKDHTLLPIQKCVERGFQERRDGRIAIKLGIRAPPSANRAALGKLQKHSECSEQVA